MRSSSAGVNDLSICAFLSKADVLPGASEYAHARRHTANGNVPCVGVIYSRKELVQLVAARGTQDLLPVKIVAYVGQIVVPMHGYIADTVRGLIKR